VPVTGQSATDDGRFFHIITDSRQAANGPNAAVTLFNAQKGPALSCAFA